MDEHSNIKSSSGATSDEKFIEHLFHKQQSREKARQDELRAQARVRRAEAKVASSVLERAVALLEGAANRWESVTGVLNGWTDERVLYGDEDWEEEDEPGVDQWSYRFVATSSPWRLRLDHFDPQGLRPDDEGGFPELFVHNTAQRLWWEVRDGKVINGGITPDRRIIDVHRQVWAAYGDTFIRDPRNWDVETGLDQNLDVLLRPAPLGLALDFVGAIETVVLGRPAIRLAAVPSPNKEELLNPNPLTDFGADQFDVAVDTEFGIVLEAIGSVEGAICKRMTLSDLEFNGTVPENLFSPPLV